MGKLTTVARSERPVLRADQHKGKPVTEDATDQRLNFLQFMGIGRVEGFLPCRSGGSVVLPLVQKRIVRLSEDGPTDVFTENAAVLTFFDEMVVKPLSKTVGAGVCSNTDDAVPAVTHFSLFTATMADVSREVLTRLESHELLEKIKVRF